MGKRILGGSVFGDLQRTNPKAKGKMMMANNSITALTRREREREREREMKNCADRRNMYPVGRIAGRQDEH
jgi:hypothetical protein